MADAIWKNTLLLLVLSLPLAGLAGAQNAGQQKYSEEGTEKCLSCHDFGASSPIHPMMEGAHGDLNNSKTPMAQKGCEHCHGPSAIHTEKPTIHKPGVSFGPRWSDSTEVQSNACLQCHENDKVHDWPTALHQRNDLTCATCHDLHVVDQAVLNPETQAGVCTVCHKVQEKGIHHLAEKKADNPTCATCHDPHADPSPVVKLLANRSEGCASCHDFRAMQKSPSVSNRAKQYHLSMAKKDQTCVDCHRGVAHSPPGSFPAPKLGGLQSADVDLFFPGKSDLDWVMGEHAGAQSFRQGRNCQQCHMGDQAEMGAKLADKGERSSVDSHLSFKKQNNELRVTISWQGDIDDSSVALMIDDGSDEEFGRAGCWASCHSDMPGMNVDAGLGLSKYLDSARDQVGIIGRDAQFKGSAALASMLKEGHYVEMWRALLKGGALDKVETSYILDKRKLDDKARVKAVAAYDKGRWTVTFAKPLTGSGKEITAGKTYTLGYAIHGKGIDAAGHWVSLPMTFSLDDIHTDFTSR